MLKEKLLDRIKIVITGGTVLVPGYPEFNAECALIAWYESALHKSAPGIAEFSFRYRNEKAKYPAAVAKFYFDLFRLFQEKMKEWIDNENPTKTGFVYGEGKPILSNSYLSKIRY